LLSFRGAEETTDDFIDLHMLRLPGPGISDPKSRSWMRDIPEQDAADDGVSIIHRSDDVGVCSCDAEGVPDGSLGDG
jgi:hypothetical protein